MSSPRVDVIIPIHSIERPIARAVGSVLTGCEAHIRVNVVCHGIAPESLRDALGDWYGDPRVRPLHMDDGIPSPAGPINVGYAAATADFTALLDSDDEYELGAVDAWLEVQRRDDADVVIQPLRLSDGRSTRTPPTRPFRRRSLDGVRDRLAYRTRQHGLVRRASFPDLAMTPGLRTGEDVIQGATLWYSGARISYARGTPAYVIHTDADDRTSTSHKPAEESLRFLDAVLSSDFCGNLTARQRESLAVKLLRTHVMDVLGASLRAGAAPADLLALSDAVIRIKRLCPEATRVLSRREARILSELTGPANPELLTAEHAVHLDYRRPTNLLSSSITSMFHREAPLRLVAALALMR